MHQDNARYPRRGTLPPGLNLARCPTVNNNVMSILLTVRGIMSQITAPVKSEDTPLASGEAK